MLLETFCYICASIATIFRISYIPECYISTVHSNIYLIDQGTTQSLSISYYDALYPEVDLSVPHWFSLPSTELSISYRDCSLSLMDYYHPVMIQDISFQFGLSSTESFLNRSITKIYDLSSTLFGYLYKLIWYILHHIVYWFNAVNKWLDDQYESFIHWKLRIQWCIYIKLRKKDRTFR
jgi:hypothetical protein